MAIFVSHYDHCLADLLYRRESGELHCEIPLVISNHSDAQRLAEFHRVPFHHIPTGSVSKQNVERKQVALLHEHSIGLVVLARYMQILSPQFVRRYPQRIINVHHSFLPAFSGARPYHRAFERGVKLIGATSHYVTADLDEGPIIEQDVVRISPRDQLDDLVQKGRDLDKVVLSRPVRWHIARRHRADPGLLLGGPAAHLFPAPAGFRRATDFTRGKGQRNQSKESEGHGKGCDQQISHWRELLSRFGISELELHAAPEALHVAGD